MRKVFSLAFIFALFLAGPSLACSDHEYEGWPGICYPKVGGTVGDAFEKAKKELANFESDARTWIQTGKCGGDICDAFKAAVQFTKAQIVDRYNSIGKAAERFAEGKPLDAIWHITTDSLRDTDKNAAEAARQSRVLQATGTVAASVYGGPAGAAAYTAWLTYHATGNIGDALKAGVITYATASALKGLDEIKMTGAEGVAARAALTGAVNGAAVAAAGGNQDQVKAAFGMGVTSVLIREGYRKLTSFELNDQRLRSSTGQAYCLAEVPDASYFNDPSSPAGCFAPRDAYVFKDGKLEMKGDGPQIIFSKLDPDRPHVGVWGKENITPYNVVAENSAAMTGVSRLPGWNAMAVAHDVLAEGIEVDILGPANYATSVATIPPALVLTYVGSGRSVYDMIHDTAVEQAKKRDQKNNAPSQPSNGGQSSTTVPSGVEDQPVEMSHFFCGRQATDQADLTERTDIVVETAVTGTLEDRPYNKLCEVRQKAKGVWYTLGHAHYEKNYCHKVAERIIRRRQSLENNCYGSIGLKAATVNSAAAEE